MAKKLTIPAKKSATTPEPSKSTKKSTEPEAQVKPAKSEKQAKSEEPEFKYGVSDLAEMLDLSPASVRVHLRNNEVERAGRSYGWNTKSELEAVAKQIKPQGRSKKEAE